MKKSIALTAILLCALLLTSCASVSSQLGTPITETTAIPKVDTVMPSTVDDESISFSDTATLYFRYLDEPYLAAETRTIRQLPSQSYELALLNELLAGPGTGSVDLAGLFPSNVRVLSTVKQGRTLFVTLSGEIMNQYADEPIDWQENDYWRREVPLRRQLCMQGIVATVTENCNVDQVQILVQSVGVTDSLRLKQNYFMDDAEDNVLVGPMTRDEALLLSPDTTLDVALSCWTTHDWQRLYLYIAARDRQTSIARPVYRDFVSRMEALPHIAAFARESGSVTANGLQATFAVDFSVLRDGQTTVLPNRIIHLSRENGLWKISLAQLTGWLEDDR